jgi:hypothetical protein
MMGMVIIAPASTACLKTLSESSTYRCKVTAVPPIVVGDFIPMLGNSSDIITNESPI